MSFKEWTVLPHDPIEELAPNLWTVSGKMPKGQQRRMVMARLEDGRIVIHNAIALSEDEMSKLDAWGEVAAIVVPNAFHRQDARIFHQRYPKAQVFAPAGAIKRVAELVPVAGDYGRVPSDRTFTAEHLDGLKEREGVLRVVSENGTRVVFNDAVLNYPLTPGIKGYLVGPTGRPSVPRFCRWMFVSDKRAFSRHLERMADRDLSAIIVGHGEHVSDDAALVLRSLAESV